MNKDKWLRRATHVTNDERADSWRGDFFLQKIRSPPILHPDEPISRGIRILTPSRFTNTRRSSEQNSVAIQDCNLISRDRYDLSVPWYLFILHFFPFPRSRHLEILESKDANRPWNRGYEDTRSARSEDFQGLLDVFLLSQRAAASSSMDERMSICPRAICNSMQPPRAETHPRFLTRKAPLWRHKRNGCRFHARHFLLPARLLVRS